MKSARLLCATFVLFTASCRHTASNLANAQGSDCSEYPVAVETPPANIQAVAEAKFKSLASIWGTKGKLEWADYLGTPESITQVSIPLDLCAKDVNTPIFDAIAETLEKTPEIFHFQSKEWVSASPKLSCADLKKADNAVITLRRDTYAGLKLDGDEIKISLTANGGQPAIGYLIGRYLSEAQPAVVAKMKSCATYDKETVLQQLEQIPSPFTILEQCIQTGTGMYEFSRKDDSVKFLQDPYWTVFRNQGQVTLFKTVMAELEIQGNKTDKVYSEDILHSDTMCSLQDQTAFAGFRIVVDGRTGQVYQRSPGIRDCLTCLQGAKGK